MSDDDIAAGTDRGGGGDGAGVDAGAALPSASRVEAFSDGVLAIAITLLILEVKVPEVESPSGLARALADTWPSYVTYLVTFGVIGIMWVNHHALFERIKVVNRTLMFLNLLLLMTISFLPFPTALLARYLRVGGQDASVAAAVYSLNALCIALAFSAMWRYLSRTPAVLADGFTTEMARTALKRAGIGPVIYAATIVIAFINPYLCLACHAGVALFFVLPGRHTGGR